MTAARQIADIDPRQLPLSPCIGICDIDEATGHCRGCARTGKEVADWAGSDKGWQAKVWARLPERRARLGLGRHILPMNQEAIADFVRGTLMPGAGTWTMGVYGGLAEFWLDLGEACRIETYEDGVMAIAARGALELRVHEKSRLFAFGGPDADGQYGALCLALPRTRLELPVEDAITPLGPDTNALRPEDRGKELFDLGLGRAVARFSVRTDDRGLYRKLLENRGGHWTEAMAAIGQELIAASPHRVVETRFGRIEVYTPIPMPGEATPDGPHTHLMPELLAMDHEIAPGQDLPPIYAPGPVFYPAKKDGLHDHRGGD